MDRKSAHCCHRHRKLLHTLRKRLCSALSLPTVNAATMYRRLTPTETTSSSNEPSEDTPVVNWRTEVKQNDAVKVSEEKELLSNAGDEMWDTSGEKETGWDRIRQAYTVDKETGFVPLESYELSLVSFISLAMGFMYGGLPAAYQLKNRYMESSQGAVYESRFHAVSDSYNARNRGLIRYGFRWGWRVAFIATSFQGLSTCLSLYRNKVDIINFGTAAFTTGAIYRYNMGITGMFGGGIAGLVVGVPAGLMLILTQKLSGETSLEKARRHRAEHLSGLKTEIDNTMQENTDAIEYMDKWLKQRKCDADKTNR